MDTSNVLFGCDYLPNGGGKNTSDFTESIDPLVEQAIRLCYSLSQNGVDIHHSNSVTNYHLADISKFSSANDCNGYKKGAIDVAVSKDWLIELYHPNKKRSDGHITLPLKVGTSEKEYTLNSLWGTGILPTVLGDDIINLQLSSYERIEQLQCLVKKYDADDEYAKTLFKDYTISEVQSVLDLNPDDFSKKRSLNKSIRGGIHELTFNDLYISPHDPNYDVFKQMLLSPNKI